MSSTSVIFCVILVLALVPEGARSIQDFAFFMRPNGTLQEGYALTLICYMDGPSPGPYPSPKSYVWVKDGKVIPGQTGVALTFRHLTKQDEGNYQCGYSGLNLARWTYQLNVDSKRLLVTVHLTSVPEVKKLPQPSIFHYREPLLARVFALNCVFLGGHIPNGNTRYAWYKNSTEVKGETGPLLRFPSLTEADEGEYKCTAWEGSPATMSPPSAVYNLEPHVPPKAYFEPTSSDPMVLGENATLTCVGPQGFESVSTFVYSWSFFPSNQRHRQLLWENSSTLRLSHLTRNHSGQYQCQARKDHDFSEQNLIERGNFTVDVVYLENISMTHDLKISEDEPLTLTCTVDSHPPAHLTWTVSGKVVRHVTDNLDHYFISSTSCSDSTNYTCRATNAKVPGQELTATTHVNVLCMQDPGHRRRQPGTIDTEMSAPFDFLLPRQTAVVIVHPSGQDIVTFFPNCSYVISERFRSRCLRSYCDLVSHHVFFALTQLTVKDEGKYVCLEQGGQRKPIPNCVRQLKVKEHRYNGGHPETNTWGIVAAVGIVLLLVSVGVVVAVLLIRRRLKKHANRCQQAYKIQLLKRQNDERS